MWEDRRILAPLIVVGLVVDNRVIGRHLPAARYKGFYLDLHSVRLKRENTLQGSLTGSELTFFYFSGSRYPEDKNSAYPPPNPLYKRLFEAEPGSRYLFFLTRDDEILRSIGDVGDYSIPVLTGAHAERLTGGEDIGKRVSEILLSRGDGVDPDRMAKKLLEYSRIADEWSSRSFTVQLLRQLSSLGEPVRSQACGVLVARYVGQYDCLQAISSDSDESPENRQEAVRELQAKTAERRQLLEELNDPAQSKFADFAGDSRHRLREEFETLLFSPDPIMHARACTALKRYFPWDAEPMCSGIK
jgi:hypothetical protein